VTLKNQPKTQNLPKQRFIFLDAFKAKKNMIWTFFIIWNYSTQKSIVLVVGIITNDNFLSLHRDLATPSLSSHQKRLKNKENKVWYQN
jgi:hypothetical protein